MNINENGKDIKIPGIDDTWHIIKTEIRNGKVIFKIKRNQKGFLIDTLWVDEEGKLV